MGMLLMRLMTTLHAKLVKATGLGGSGKPGSVLVLEHVGAKTGKRRTTPLMFVEHGGGYAVVASMAGAPNNPGWYHNLKANPDAQATVARRTTPVRARELDGAERAEVWEKFTQLGPQWEKYETRTDRVMPIMALEPRG